MWDKIKEWYKQNKGYLTTLLIGSLVIGLGITLLSFFCPPVLAAFAGISLFGITPLAFLTALYLPVAALTLGSIVTGVAFAAILGGIVVWKQLIDIGKHVYSHFESKEAGNADVNDQETYNYLMEHLEGEKSESFEMEDDEEFNDYSTSDSFEDDKPKHPTKSTSHVLGESDIVTEGLRI